MVTTWQGSITLRWRRRLLIDEDVLEGEELGCHSCVCTSSLKLKTADVIGKFLHATGHEYRVVHLACED